MIEALAGQMNLGQSRPAYVPLSDENLLTDESSSPLDEREHKRYRLAIGQIMHISSWTRPDAAYTAHRLACKLAAPTKSNLTAAKNLVRYLVATNDHPLVFSSQSDKELVCYSDSNWATALESQSTSGNIWFIRTCPVFWAAKKQTLVALSTCEAEFNAATNAACDAAWMRKLYQEIFWTDSAPLVTLYMDNKSAILTAENQGYTPRNRHYLIRNDFLRQCVQNRELRISYVSTNDMIADGFTKGLQRQKHHEFLRKVSVLKPNDS